MKYQKKPVIIEAFEFPGELQHVTVPIWLVEALDDGTVEVLVNEFNTDEGLEEEVFMDIETLEGPMRASVGDYIIQGIHGEIYSCKPDIFNETYIKID